MKNLYYVRFKGSDYFFNDQFKLIDIWSDTEKYRQGSDLESLLYSLGFYLFVLDASDPRVFDQIIKSSNSDLILLL